MAPTCWCGGELLEFAHPAYGECARCGTLMRRDRQPAARAEGLSQLPDPVSALARVTDGLAPGVLANLLVPRYAGQGADWARFAPGQLFLPTAASMHDLMRYCGLDVVALHKGPAPDDMLAVGRRRASSTPGPQGRYRPSIGIGMVEHMGDVFATEPVVRYLRQLHPQASISWVTREPYTAIVAANPGIDEVVRVECVTDWIRMLRHRKFDVAYDLHINGRKCTACQIPLQKTGRCSSINFGNIFAGRSVLEGSCKAAGLPAMDETPQVHIPDSARARVDALALPERFVALHCVSEDPSRTWPAPEWVRLAELIHDNFRIPVVEIGLAPVLEGIRGVNTSACGLPIVDTAELIRRAAGMVCVNSGFSQVANGCRVPSVVLAGKYEHYTYLYPFSGAFARENFDYVFNRGGTARELGFDAVAGAVSKLLAAITSRTASR